MKGRIKTTLLLFSLVLMVILIGNNIHLLLIQKSMDSENKDTYLKIDKNKIAILIEVDKKRLSVIDLATGSTIKSYVVATGKPETPTPLGTFKIVEKAKWGGGFGSRWIGLDVPWGKYGIHGTNKPGSIGFNASAGCIRMRNKDVEELYSLMNYNTTVAIVSGDYGPFAHGFRKLRPGDRGSDVMEVQKRLKLKGYYTGVLDGIYGEGMKHALIQYLKDNDLALTDTIEYEIYEKLGIILMD